MNLLPSQCCLSTSFFNVTKVSGISTSARPSYLLPICGFGSAFWSDAWISQSVIKHQSTVWCVRRSNACQRKKAKRWQRSARWCFPTFLLLFLWELGTTTGRWEADFWALCLSGRIRDLMLIHDLSWRIHKRKIAETICITHRYLSRC